MFQSGFCIVDSPGFSENEQLNNVLKDYFKQALAFIYIIQTSNAGGVQEDGVWVRKGNENIVATTTVVFSWSE